jgi:hypothetical protein
MIFETMKGQNRRTTKKVNLKLGQISEGFDQILSSENDRKIFFKSLLNPPIPNENLRKAFQLHEEFVKNSH